MRSGSQPATPGRPDHVLADRARAPGTAASFARVRMTPRASRAGAPRRGPRAGGARRRATPAGARTARSSARAASRGRPRRCRCAAVGDVQHRALRERADDLVRRREHRVGAQGERAGRQVGVEAEVRAPCLVDDERRRPRRGDLGAARDVGDHAVVRRRDEEHGTRVRRRLERPRERLGRDAVGHAQLGVVLGRDERRHAAAEDEPVDDRRVRVALRDDLARRAAPARGTARGCPGSRRS